MASSQDHRQSSVNQMAQKYPFPIVGIGASAGGLDAFTQLLRNLSMETGMAFVLIQHLDPQHKSLLVEILARTTKMPVSEVIDGLKIEPNRIYVIPPNKQMMFVDGRLELSPRQKTGSVYHPIDLFFRSIATACGSRAIGVVLSGADGDGALGLSAIKAAGGITFAQDIPSAQYGGMPQSAANTGQVDFILPPGEIATKLNRLGAGYPVAISPIYTVDSPPIDPHSDPLLQIFELLRLHTGVNFISYKPATLNRRMQRRMHQHQIVELADYLTYLLVDLGEIEELYRDILIGVTSFFRDIEAFQSLKDRILPQIALEHDKSPIRIWVAGCSTGEEAYSVAICLIEVLAQLNLQHRIQIFATDLNEVSIDIARAGIYPQQSLKGVSPERLQRFFIPVQAGYQISKSVRELCVFARQNLCSDPPFSRLDLIVCRNVLIYFGAPLQKRVMQTLHYGLNPSGILMLGSSESANGSPELFSLLTNKDSQSFNKKCKFYTKKLTLALPDLDFTTSRDFQHLAHQQMIASENQQVDLHQIVNDLLCQHYAPVGAIVNANDLEILQFRGDTSPYLSLPPGKPSFNLLKMVRVDLRLELRGAIIRAKKQQLPISQFDLTGLVKFQVIPFQVPSLTDPHLLILFEQTTQPQLPPLERVTRKIKGSLLEQENIRLKRELALSQEQIQSMIQAQDLIEQDIRAVNEEMLSSNEEFQITNEELETAKEEVQATNEELSIVNDELRSRNVESTQLNNDLINVLSSVQLPILIVEHDLRIGRFTTMAAPIFNLIPTDIGRLFTDIRHNLAIEGLDLSILETIATQAMYQQELQDNSGHWYHLTIRPYQTLNNRVAGATILLVDIHALKQHAQELQAAIDYAGAIVETIWEPLIVLDARLHIVTANHAFYEMFEVTPLEVEGHPLDELGNGQWDIPGLRSQLSVMLDCDVQLKDFQVEHLFEQIGQKTMLLNAKQILTSDNRQLILLAIVDMTDRQQIEAERVRLSLQEQAARATAETANLAKDVFLSMLSHELRNPLSAILGWARLLRSDKLNPTQIKHGLEVIDRSATTQNQLIEDLLDISSITNGKIHLDAKPIDPVDIITNAIETVSLSAAAKNIQIQTQLDVTPHQILGDSTRFQQILWNLLGNAIKFTEPGGKITIRMSVLRAIKPAKIISIQIQIIDSGKGIEPEFLPYIFDRFLQADSSSTRTYAGLGLGLTIVRHLVELHGGTISATSEVGVGSTFTLLIPCLDPLTFQAEFPEFMAIRNKLSRLTIPTDVPDLTGIHVLVVDDETDVRALITTILNQYGATVTAVASPPAALETLQASPTAYHVLLSDIGMPGQDGWAFIRQVRKLSPEAGGLIPAAALTAYSSDRDLRMALQLGFQVHIAKPIEPDVLAAIVADLARE